MEEGRERGGDSKRNGRRSRKSSGVRNERGVIKDKREQQVYMSLHQQHYIPNYTNSITSRLDTNRLIALIS